MGLRVSMRSILCVGCVVKAALQHPEAPAQHCRHDAGPPWADDEGHFGNGAYFDGTPAEPLGDCPEPLAAACAAKGKKAAFLDGPIDCGGKGWFCRITPQAGWRNPEYDNFALCSASDADERDDDGHCHGSDSDDTYGWWVRDHWWRGYAGELTCSCDWSKLEGLVNRCDYRRHVSADEAGQCRDANERHGMSYEDGCAKHSDKPFEDPCEREDSQCWTVMSFADPESVSGDGDEGDEEEDASTCNKNNRCEEGSFCACDHSHCGTYSSCQTCESVGQPSFDTGNVQCERYERSCGYKCDGSNYEESQACVGDRVWWECGSSCEKICGEEPDEACAEVCVSSCQCPEHTVLESADGDTCIKKKDCRKHSDDDKTYWGSADDDNTAQDDDDKSGWWRDDADGAKDRSTADDDESEAATGERGDDLLTTPDAAEIGIMLGVALAGIVTGAACVHGRRRRKAPGPVVELGQIIVAEAAVLKDLPRADLEEPLPAVPTATPV